MYATFLIKVHCSVFFGGQIFVLAGKVLCTIDKLSPTQVNKKYVKWFILQRKCPIKFLKCMNKLFN